MTNKKGDKTGDKGRQKGDKADTTTNKKPLIPQLEVHRSRSTPN